MKRIVGFALALAILYVFVFARPLPAELVPKPVWAQDLAHPLKLASARSPARVGFRMGDVFGYVAPDGLVTFLDTVQAGVTMSDERYSNYSSVSGNLVVKDSAGRVVFNVDSGGYPVMEAGRLFVVSSDRTSLGELDRRGASLWRRDFGSIITSIDASASRLAVGLLDGRLMVIARGGRRLFVYAPRGEDPKVVYGVALSPDNAYLAAVAGLHPQRLYLLRERGEAYAPVRSVELPSASRSQVFLHLFEGIPYAFAESPDGLRYAGFGGGAAGLIPSGGAPIEDVAAATSRRLIEATGEDPAGRGAALRIIEPPGQVVATLPLPGSALFLRSLGERVYFGSERELARLDLVER